MVDGGIELSSLDHEWKPRGFLHNGINCFWVCVCFYIIWSPHKMHLATPVVSHRLPYNWVTVHQLWSIDRHPHLIHESGLVGIFTSVFIYALTKLLTGYFAWILAYFSIGWKIVKIVAINVFFFWTSYLGLYKQYVVRQAQMGFENVFVDHKDWFQTVHFSCLVIFYFIL